jgi:DNA-binding transcriptional MerR regulator
MQIGELAAKAKVNIQTIRFYERLRILPPPLRRSSGYRIYSDSDLARLQFIRLSQDLGFTLAEIKQLMGLHETMASPKAHTRRPAELFGMAGIAHRRLQQVEDKLRHLKSMRMQLLQFIDQLETMSTPVCPAAGKVSRLKPSKVST